MEKNNNGRAGGKRGSKLPAIIDAALQVFGEKGFYSATIAEIAKKAGVSEATVYEYCGSKEDLLFAIPEEITRRSVEFLEAVLPFVKGAENRLRAVVYGYFTIYRDNSSKARRTACARSSTAISRSTATTRITRAWCCWTSNTTGSSWRRRAITWSAVPPAC